MNWNGVRFQEEVGAEGAQESGWAEDTVDRGVWVRGGLSKDMNAWVEAREGDGDGDVTCGPVAVRSHGCIQDIWRSGPSCWAWGSVGRARGGLRRAFLLLPRLFCGNGGSGW